MTVTYTTSPLTLSEITAGWGAVIRFSVPQLRPVYLLRAEDARDWHQSPMAAIMASSMGVQFLQDMGA